MATIPAQSWWGLIVYGIVMGLVIKGYKIPLPLGLSTSIRRILVVARLASPLPEVSSNTSRYRIPIDLRTAPVMAVTLLLITRTINGDVVRQGIVGTKGGAQPYNVLILFISLAYISTSLDSTGAIRSLALGVAKRSTDGRKLFTLFYFFWFFISIFIGNDPVILSGTAFLTYFTRVCGIVDPTAFLFSQFHAANIASAILVSSNPTNILIAGAFSLNFITGFTAYTTLPAIISAAVSFPFLYLGFTWFKPRSTDSHSSQSYIPARLLPPDVDPSQMLLDRSGAIFHIALLAITLTLLVGTSSLTSIEVWMITAPAGTIAFARDLIADWRNTRKRDLPSVDGGVELQRRTCASSAVGSTPLQVSTPPSSLARKSTSFRQSFPQQFTSAFPSTSSTLSRLPMSLVLFAGGIFILSGSLKYLGWTSIFATWLARICINPAVTIFAIGYLTSFVFCPLLGTNIGATIILVEVLQDANFSSRVDAISMRGAIYSLALSSNLGAISATISSSLAGLLWNTILKSKMIRVKKLDFLVINLLTLSILSTSASSIILLEVYYFAA